MTRRQHSHSQPNQLLVVVSPPPPPPPPPRRSHHASCPCAFYSSYPSTTTTTTTTTRTRARRAPTQTSDSDTTRKASQCDARRPPSPAVAMRVPTYDARPGAKAYSGLGERLLASMGWSKCVCDAMRCGCGCSCRCDASGGCAGECVVHELVLLSSSSSSSLSAGG